VGPGFVTNARYSEMIKTMHGFANESCIVLIFSKDLVFLTRTQSHFLLTFLLEIAKLLRCAAASFLNTAAMYCLHVGMVLKMTMTGMS
jgi:hypothetical protein